MNFVTYCCSCKKNYIRKATPNYTAGCKRLLLSNTYYAALDHCSLEIVTDNIREVTATGIIDSLGTIREVDAIIFGTGFATQEIPRPGSARGVVKGKGGRDLGKEWDAMGGAEVSSE